MTQNVTSIEPLISAEAIQKRTRELGRAVSQDFAQEEIFLICVLKGAFFFFTNLVRAVAIPLEIGFIGCSSYGHKRMSSGNLNIYLDLQEDIQNKNVIVVEDIIDTGQSMKTILAMLRSKRPKVLKIASLLSKPSCRKVDISIDYLGFEIEDQFVVGHGLDDKQKLRELPYIGIVPH